MPFQKISAVKVGIVGLGLVSDSHIKGYQSHPDAQVIAVCDLDEQRAKQVCQKYGIAKHYTAFDAMLKDPDINTIDITTPTHLHAPMALAAARAGKHILCEKPFALSLHECEQVVAAARDYKVCLAVGESYVFMTSIKKARELVDAGAIGKPQQIRQRFGTWLERPGALDDGRPVTENHVGWRMDSQKAGGGGFPWFFDHFIHFFATAEYLMKSRIKEVYALKSDTGWMQQQQTTENREGMHLYQPESSDIPIVTWTYEDTACQGVWMRAEALNGKYDPMFGFSVSLIGDQGMIEVLGEGGNGLQWQGEDAHLVLHRKSGETQTLRFDAEGGDDIWQSGVSYYSRAHQNQIHEFVHALTTGTPPRYTGTDGWRDIKTTMATLCSAREGIPVMVSHVSDQRFGQLSA